MTKKLNLLMITLLIFGLYSCTSSSYIDNGSLTKKAAKFVAKQAIEAGKGINEVLKSDNGKIAESTTESVGELVYGASKGLEKVSSEKGQEIGENLGKATVTFLSGYGQGLEDNLTDFKWKVSEKSSNDLQVLGATKTLIPAKKVNIYIRFLKSGNLKVRLDVYDKNCTELLGSVSTTVNVNKYDFKAIDFDFGNSETVQLGDCMIVTLE
ncbi:MAG: hypothetical protein IPO21_14780 [Bacteroidales bacterium]|nr:hypothetical protein [Bacteroidales bacterium]